ncbi:MAG: metallophosphoesterase [Pseudomonadota bacterium]
MDRFAHNLLVLSDVHLGSDLVHHVRPGAPQPSRASERRRRELVALLEHYAASPRGGLPWRLVIAGDFVDFTGMSVLPECALETELTEEERAHGLGGAEDHALAKLRLVLDHERAIVRALAEFLARGHSLVVVRGNHDVEWYWKRLRDAFRAELDAYAPGAGDRVEFSDWFYYEPGAVYIEHGHQYDAYCSYEYLLCPLSPSDPRRTTRSISDVLLRYVVRPTPGMTEAGHGTTGRLDYLKFAARLGSRGIVQLAQRFLRANRALVRLWREHSSAAVEHIRREHERALERLSREHRLPLATLRHLDALRRPPITRHLLGVFASVMVDRVLLGIVGTAALVALTLLSSSRRMAWSSSGGALAVLLGADAAWSRLRSSAEPSPELRERAAHVAKLLDVRYVVMGHTHLPEVTSPIPRATYVNLGAWAEDDMDDGPPPLPATRTHLVITRNAARGEAELLQWTPEGPRPFFPEPEAEHAPARLFDALPVETPLSQRS